MNRCYHNEWSNSWASLHCKIVHKTVCTAVDTVAFNVILCRESINEHTKPILPDEQINSVCSSVLSDQNRLETTSENVVLTLLDRKNDKTTTNHYMKYDIKSTAEQITRLLLDKHFMCEPFTVSLVMITVQS